jgi:hypothetical protein
MPFIPKHIQVFSLPGIGGTLFGQWGLIVAAYSANAAGPCPPQAHPAALLFTAVGHLLSLIWYLSLACQK